MIKKKAQDKSGKQGVQGIQTKSKHKINVVKKTVQKNQGITLAYLVCTLQYTHIFIDMHDHV